MARVETGVNKVDQGRGVAYGYGGQESPAYRLGERPVSPFIDTVYGRLNSLAPGSIVIDLGGGAGRFPAQAPQDRKWRVLGIDHDPDAINQAHRVIRPDDRAIVGDITRLAQLSLPDGMDTGDISAVVSHRVLHAVPLSLRRPIIEGGAGMLPPGGEFYASVASIEDWKAGQVNAEPGVVYDCAPIMFGAFDIPRRDPFAMSFFDDTAMATLIAGSGLVIQGASTFTEPSGYDHITEPNTYRGYLLKVDKSTAESTARGSVVWTLNGNH